MKPFIIIKIGGSILTYKKSQIPKLRRQRLQSIAVILKEFQSIYRLVIIIGAGSFGHPLAKKYQINKGLSRVKDKVEFKDWHKALEIHLKVADLSQKVAQILIQAGINAVAFSPFTQFTETKIQSEAIKNILKYNLVPLFHGDLLCDEKKGVRIISGDEILAVVGQKLKARRIVYITKGNGFYAPKNLLKSSRNKSVLTKKVHVPQISGQALRKILDKMESEKETNFDTTGGFKSKLQWCLRYIPPEGIRIINGTAIQDIKKGLIDNQGGTLII